MQTDTFGRVLTFFAAILANVGGFLGAFGCRMSFFVTDAAGTLENARFGAVGFIVTFLATIETSTAASTWLRAFTGKMTRLAAAI